MPSSKTSGAGAGAAVEADDAAAWPEAAHIEEILSITKFTAV